MVKKATVLDQVAPRSYRILSEDDEENRRNSQHLRCTTEAFIFINLYDDGMTKNVQPLRDSEVPRTPDEDYDDNAWSSAPVTEPVEPNTIAESTLDTQLV